MTTKIIVNGQTVVHKDSGGVVTTSPDVCMTPIGAGIVPVPYLNVAKSADTSNGSETMTVEGNPIMLKGSFFGESSGNEAGNAGGVSSGVNKGKAAFVNYSFDVFVEGKPVCRRLDPMVSNLGRAGNTPPAALVQENIEAEGTDAEAHLVALALQFEHPNTVTQHISQPLFDVGYVIDGPETLRSEKAGRYVGLQHLVKREGTYSINFVGFDRGQKPLDREKHENH